MRRYFCIVIGSWRLENWHLYRWRAHHAALHPEITWHDWDRIL